MFKYLKGWLRYWPQIFVVLFLFFSYQMYNYLAYFDLDSDDAYVSANVLPIRILKSGELKALYVKDNQWVEEGQLLAGFDSKPFLIAMAKARTALVIAEKNNDSEAVRQAKAALVKAETGLQKSQLKAPVSGYISHLNWTVGQYLQQGLDQFALIDDSEWWVIAHFRETSLRLIQPGDRVKIKLDMYPGKTFEGKVESIGWGVNIQSPEQSSNSLLPDIKRTENWIHLAQRFPVRIIIESRDKSTPFRVGASASIRVLK